MKFIGSRGLNERHIDLLGRVIFWTALYPLKSYKIRERSLQDAQSKLGSEGLYFTFKILSTFHSSWYIGFVLS